MDNKYVTKATGEREEFNPQKLRDSLAKAGVGLEETENIVSQIEKDLKDNASTKDIYYNAFELLCESKTCPIVDSTWLSSLHFPFIWRFMILDNAVIDWSKI